jgi:hypothetical protein
VRRITVKPAIRVYSMRNPIQAILHSGWCVGCSGERGLRLSAPQSWTYCDCRAVRGSKIGSQRKDMRKQIRTIIGTAGATKGSHPLRKLPLFRPSDRPWLTKLTKQSDIAAAKCGQGFLPIGERGDLCTRIYRLCSTDDVFRGHYSSTLRMVGVNDVAMSPCRSVATLRRCALLRNG